MVEYELAIQYFHFSLRQIKPEDLPLLSQKLETMREEERFDVNVLLEHHHELRKRKSKVTIPMKLILIH